MSRSQRVDHGCKCLYLYLLYVYTVNTTTYTQIHAYIHTYIDIIIQRYGHVFTKDCLRNFAPIDKAVNWKFTYDDECMFDWSINLYKVMISFPIRKRRNSLKYCMQTMPTHLREHNEKDYIINCDLSTDRYPFYNFPQHLRVLFIRW